MTSAFGQKGNCSIHKPFNQNFFRDIFEKVTYGDQIKISKEILIEYYSLLSTREINRSIQLNKKSEHSGSIGRVMT